MTVFQLGSNLGLGSYTGGFTHVATGTPSLPPVMVASSSSAFVAGVATPAPLAQALAVLPAGNLLFNDNQCLLLAAASDNRMLGLTSVLLLSLDDAGVADNQLDVRLLGARVAANLVAGGLSVRVGGNRFKEGLGLVAMSGMTVGFMNVTTHNEANHCLIVRGLPALTVDQPNVELLDALVPGLCARFGEVLGAAGRKGVIG